MKRFISTLIGLVMFSGVSMAATYNSAMEKAILADNQGSYNDYNDIAAFSISYDGSEDGTASMTISRPLIANNYAAYTTVKGSTVTCSAGTDSFTFCTSAAAYDTVGELFDAIVATNTAYKCIWLDGLRSDRAALLANVSAQNIKNGVTGSTGTYNLIYSTGGYANTTTYESGIGIHPTPSDSAYVAGEAGSSSDRKLRLTGCTTVRSGVGKIKIYERDSDGTETVRYGQALVDNTLTFIPGTAYNPMFAGRYEGIDVAAGSSIIIRSLGMTYTTTVDTQVDATDFCSETHIEYRE